GRYSLHKFFLWAGQAVRDAQPQVRVQGGWPLGTGPEGKGRHPPLPHDLGALGIAELTKVRGIDQCEGGITRHENGVCLVAAVGGHARWTDLVRVDRIPPVFDDFTMARLGDRRLEFRGLELLVVAFQERLEDVALVGPHGPPEAEPGVVHGHATDVAPLDLAVLLQALADLDQLVEGLWHLLGLYQVATIKEGADRVRHR